MSYKDCITNGVAEGKVTKDQADEQIKLFDERVKEHLSKGLSQDEAKKLAGKEAFDSFKFDAIDKQRRDLLMLQKQQALIKFMNEYKNYRGEKDYGNAAVATLAPDIMNTRVNVETSTKEIRAKAHQIMTDFLETFRPKIGGFARNKTTLNLVIKELFEPGTTNSQSAKELAEAYNTSREYLRLRFNKAGGRIAFLKNYGIPTMHDVLEIRKANREDWINYTIDRIDFKNMISERTNLPFTQETIRIALTDVYENIINEGFNKLKPGQKFFPGSVASRYTDHRFLKFKNAQSWLEYQQKYGNSNVFDVINSHIDKMSRDISLMEIWGPNPDATLAWITTLVRKQSKADVSKQLRLPQAEKELAQVKEKLKASKDPVEIEKLNRLVSEYTQDIAEAKLFQRKSIGTFIGIDEESRANSKIEQIKNLFAYHKGALTTPVNNYAGRTFAGLRHFLTSAKLGSAAMLATTDFFYSATASKFNGLPQWRTARTTLKLLTDPLQGNKLAKLALRLQLGAEHWSALAYANTRFMGEIEAPEIAKRLSDTVLRASGLSHLSQAGKWSFGMELMGFWAENVNKTFKELPTETQSQFIKYGINEKSWDIIRKTKLYDAGIDDVDYANKGMVFLRPDEIRSRTDLPDNIREELTTKLLNYLNTETNFAIPSTSVKGRVLLSGSSKPGTVSGEMALSVLQWKNFPITYVSTHIMRGLTQNTYTGKAKYLVPLVIGTTLMGAVINEMREIAKGRDFTTLKKMKEFKYWFKATVVGGGLGYVGDFLDQSQNQYGKSLPSYVLGPVVGFGADVGELAVGNTFKLASGKETSLGNDVSNFIRQYTPGASVWWIKLALERLIFDQLQKMIDPKFNNRISRKIRKYKKEEGRGYFWKPGELLPRRSPEVDILR